MNKNLRISLRLSQSELARRSGVNRIRICLSELGDLNLTAAESNRVRAALCQEAERIRSLSESLAVDIRSADPVTLAGAA